MSCSVAVAGASPVFSPSHISLSFKASPESLTLTHGLRAASEASPSAASASSSPFRFRLQRGAGGLWASSFGKEAIVALDSPGKRASPVASADPCALLQGAPLAPAAAATSTLLKRKRPARIDIPAMQSLDLAARSGCGEEVVEVQSARFSVFCKRGKTRKEMEDRYKAAVDVNGNPRLAFFGIFDGHGGTNAAVFAADNIDKHVMDEMAKRSIENGDRYKEAIKTAYLKTDVEFLEKEEVGGACCVTAVISDGDLIVSNAGDCRAVMSSGGTAEALTSDHRPSREDERDRIERLGSLAISRGIGDRHLKQWVIAEPETKILRIKPEYEFLILASDGLWDKVTNQEAVDIARPLCMNCDKQSRLSACKKLVDLSVARGSVDDVSVVIIQLRDFL
ncbi:hypothetical protein Taro_015689 [Colocasia esculenta]|uniref:protein-serine/threonine phosphatase n=1 Tax=Colocasia esculenta TaxID=4460 RepID=A0A843UC05_COLES|nr:hypothetical protein [Colocasia esculenta]